MAMLVTHISAAAAALVWMVIEWLQLRQTEHVGVVTGTVAGLVAITPASGFVGPPARSSSASPPARSATSRRSPKRALGIDDSLDVFAVHGVGGIIGTLLTGDLRRCGAWRHWPCRGPDHRRVSSRSSSPGVAARPLWSLVRERRHRQGRPGLLPTCASAATPKSKASTFASMASAATTCNRVGEALGSYKALQEQRRDHRAGKGTFGDVVTRRFILSACRKAPTAACATEDRRRFYRCKQPSSRSRRRCRAVEGRAERHRAARKRGDGDEVIGASSSARLSARRARRGALRIGVADLHVMPFRLAALAACRHCRRLNSRRGYQHA